ncbi:hypothetical protein NC653_032633 [Populus alba x Populus x berolinensis]|uniref:Uncharacterized protein n=1 Tax=Populus alba x Populus x berolinensis TaxID=444605 RepID=A0AAD6PY80_9ROSI|nr:hypothetical protein NC653_032633 [Populus alba x Populus x berolinensis]
MQKPPFPGQELRYNITVANEKKTMLLVLPEIIAILSFTNNIVYNIGDSMYQKEAGVVAEV